jgi:hypothetical protein
MTIAITITIHKMKRNTVVPREPPPKFKARNSGPGVVVLSWSVPAFDDVTDYTYYVTYNISMTKVKQVSFCLNGVVYRFSKFVST